MKKVANLHSGQERRSEAFLGQRKRRKRERWFVTGAMLAMAVTIAATLWVLRGRTEEFATEMAERQVALLDDGSRVELNAETKLKVRLGRRERRVTLTRGEALFAVASDPARPFIVETSAGAVRATGTIFNVRAATVDARVEVTVLEGSVRVRAKSEATGEVDLSAGRQARFQAADHLSVWTLPEGAAQDAVAWRQGQVVFHDAPLGEALERFAAYHAKEIVVDRSAAELRLGGRFALDDLNGLLDSVERVLPVRVVREAGGVWRIKHSAP
jgi:transmembrane sensor